MRHSITPDWNVQCLSVELLYKSKCVNESDKNSMGHLKYTREQSMGKEKAVRQEKKNSPARMFYDDWTKWSTKADI